MAALRNPTVFNFCAIPQVMAIATLARCYNNYGVFTSVVKIRKGEAAKLILRARSMDAIFAVFADYLDEISAKFSTMATPYFDTAALIVAIRKAHGLPDDPNVRPSGALVLRARKGAVTALSRALQWSLLAASLYGLVALALSSRGGPPSLMRLLPSHGSGRFAAAATAAWSTWSGVQSTAAL